MCSCVANDLSLIGPLISEWQSPGRIQRFLVLTPGSVSEMPINRLRRNTGRANTLHSHSSRCQVDSVMSNFLQPYGLQPARLLCPGDSPGKSTGVGCHYLLQGIFLIQGMNPLLMSPAFAGRFFTTNATQEAQNTWRIFLTLGSNLGLMHCILYAYAFFSNKATREIHSSPGPYMICIANQAIITKEPKALIRQTFIPCSCMCPKVRRQSWPRSHLGPLKSQFTPKHTTQGRCFSAYHLPTMERGDNPQVCLV